MKSPFYLDRSPQPQPRPEWSLQDYVLAIFQNGAILLALPHRTLIPEQAVDLCTALACGGPAYQHPSADLIKVGAYVVRRKADGDIRFTATTADHARALMAVEQDFYGSWHQKMGWPVDTFVLDPDPTPTAIRHLVHPDVTPTDYRGWLSSIHRRW